MSAFLDNSGDIILDAVLTDEGRRRLSLGDGSFRITKFALADDEIDYGLYDKTQSGTNKDTNIFSTPILEAITNNTASVLNKLMTIPRNDLLFLPVLKVDTGLQPYSSITGYTTAYIVPVLSNTLTSGVDNSIVNLRNGNANLFQGVLTDLSNVYNNIGFAQGLDTSKLSNTLLLKDFDMSLVEKEFNVYIDNRLGEIGSTNGSSFFAKTPKTVDDDNIAIYSFNIDTDADMFIQNPSSSTVINGPIGNILQFTIRPKINLTSDYLFSELGQTVVDFSNSQDYKLIKTEVRVEGATTGVSTDVSVIFAKYTA